MKRDWGLIALYAVFALSAVAVIDDQQIPPGLLRRLLVDAIVLVPVKWFFNLMDKTERKDSE